MVKVIKKDGRKVPFHKEKILNNLKSIENVFDIKIKKDKMGIVNNIFDQVKNLKEIDSKELDLLVERELESDKYILSLFKHYKENEQKEIDRYTDIEYQLAKLEEKDPSIVNENGNKDSRTFVTQRDLVASIVAKSKGLKQYEEAVQRAHMKGMIHLHDLDRSPYQALPNCSLPNFEYLLSHGFDVGTTHVTPAQSIETAVSHLSILISAITGEQYGGISVHMIDRLLAPYAEKTYKKNYQLFFNHGDSIFESKANAIKKTKKDIFKAMESLEYEINTITAHSAQTPFTTLSFGIERGIWAKEIQKAILQVRLNGMKNENGNEITAIFPKLLYFVKDGINLKKTDPLYDVKQLAMECSRKRTYPDMLSVENLLKLKGGTEPITAMGCRSFLHSWNRPSTGEEEVVGRNNWGVVSLNLVRPAIQAEGNAELYFELLDEVLEIVKSALHTRENVVLSADLSSAPIMYTQGGLLGKGQEIEDIKSIKDLYSNDNIKRSTISVGYVGIYNAMVALFNDEKWYEKEDLKQFSIDILNHIQKYIDSIQDEFTAYVSLYATPSESLATRFRKLDQKRFCNIPNVTSNGYYENSFHFPSNKDINGFDKIDFESDYYWISNAGFMHYVEQPNLNNNPKAFESLWDYAHEKLAYFGINTPNDTCYVCGFEGEFNVDKDGYECPNCGNRDGEKMNVVRRLCGYLGQPATRPVVSGKQQEIANRVKH